MSSGLGLREPDGARGLELPWLPLLWRILMVTIKCTRACISFIFVNLIIFILREFGVTVEEARPQVPELGWDIQEALLSRLTPKQVARLSRTSRAWRNYSDKRWEEERQRLVDAYFEREPLAHRTLECVARASVGLDVVTGEQLEYDFVWHQRHVRVDEGSDVLDFTQQASMVFGVRHTHLRLYCYAPKRPCWCTNQPRLITLSWKEGKLVSIWGSLNAAEIEYLAGFFIKVEELSIRGKPAGGGIKARPSRGFRAIRKWWFL